MNPGNLKRLISAMVFSNWKNVEMEELGRPFRWWMVAIWRNGRAPTVGTVPLPMSRSNQRTLISDCCQIELTGGFSGLLWRSRRLVRQRNRIDSFKLDLCSWSVRWFRQCRDNNLPAEVPGGRLRLGRSPCFLPESLPRSGLSGPFELRQTTPTLDVLWKVPALGDRRPASTCASGRPKELSEPRFLRDNAYIAQARQSGGLDGQTILVSTSLSAAKPIRGTIAQKQGRCDRLQDAPHGKGRSPDPMRVLTGILADVQLRMRSFSARGPRHSDFSRLEAGFVPFLLKPNIRKDADCSNPNCL
jgi:hypothetical protein